MAYFLVTESRGPEWDSSRPRRGQRDFAEHAAIMDRLVDEGTILLGGPVGQDPDAGDVVLVVEASNEAGVHAALSVDRWIGTVLTVARVEPWTLWLRREGIAVDN
jgi:uncharacterized protein YciI